MVAAIALALPFSAAASQMPSVPVLQNGFAAGGFTVAANYGIDESASAYAVAASWGPASARFLVSGAIGGVSPETGTSWAAYGVRAAIPVLSAMSERFGVAVFGGVGGARRDTTTVVRVPVGVGVGYRFMIGETRSIAAYASPFFVWTRVSEKGTRSESDNEVRGSVAADVVITRNIGLTAGYEFGGEGDARAPGSAKGLFGAAVSYAFR